MQTYKVIVDGDKNRFWYNEMNQFHRLDGPAIERVDGCKAWYVKGELHRLDGPAIEYANGSKAWFVEGKHHRLDGPAFENASGYEEWWVNGELHRLDGPAIECAEGSKEWFVKGKKLTEEEFNAYIKPKQTCEGKVVEVDGIKYKLTKA